MRNREPGSGTVRLIGVNLQRGLLVVAIAAIMISLASCGQQLATGSPAGRSAGSGGRSSGGPQPGPTGAAASAGTAASAGAAATAGTTASAGTATAPAAAVITLPTGASTVTSRPPIVIGRTGHLTLTEADNGATVVLTAGRSVSVVLGGGQPAWDRPRVAGAALRLVSASGGYPGGLPARATVRAVQAGTATISSISDAACLHAVPACEIAQRPWLVTVIVRS